MKKATYSHKIRNLCVDCGKICEDERAKICSDCWLKRQPKEVLEWMKEQEEILNTIARIAGQ